MCVVVCESQILTGSSKCTPNGPSTLASASLVTRPRPKAGGRVLNAVCLFFLCVFFPFADFCTLDADWLAA